MRSKRPFFPKLFLLAVLLVVVTIALYPYLRRGQQSTTLLVQPLPTQTSHPTHLFPVAATVASSTASASPTSKQPPTVKTKTSAPIAQPAAQTPTGITITKNIDESDIAAATKSLRESTVNLFCTGTLNGFRESMSGTGVIIDPAGVVLTSAHVAQFMLLKTFTCIIRTGSPANTAYQASLLYLPPQWIAENAYKIAESDATSTGQYDFAFVYMQNTGKTFPRSNITTGVPPKNDPVIIAAYPAQYLNGNTVQSDLYISSVASTLGTLYTFTEGGKTIDEFSLASSALSQSGSSGGGVARAEDGAVFGLITTQTQGDNTSQRELNAITVGHIDRSLKEFGEGGIEALMSGDSAQKSKDFMTNTAPTLAAQLQKYIR
jgi:hypothetical protein